MATFDVTPKLQLRGRAGTFGVYYEGHLLGYVSQNEDESYSINGQTTKYVSKFGAAKALQARKVYGR